MYDTNTLLKSNIMGEIWAIILAAGESKRMGSPKMLLHFNGSTIIETVIRIVRNSNIDNVMVVLGAERQKLSELVIKLNVKSCYNSDYKTGMLSSVICGVRNLPADFEAILVFQGDQPMIHSESINNVIKAYKLSGRGIVIPVFEKKRGHPILIDRRYKNEIEKLDSGVGLRSLVYKYPEDILEVETADPGILRDIDTSEEYLKEISI